MVHRVIVGTGQVSLEAMRELLEADCCLIGSFPDGYQYDEFVTNKFPYI